MIVKYKKNGEQKQIIAYPASQDFRCAAAIAVAKRYTYEWRTESDKLEADGEAHYKQFNWDVRITDLEFEPTEEEKRGRYTYPAHRGKPNEDHVRKIDYSIRKQAVRDQWD